MSRILLKNGLLDFICDACAVKEEIIEMEGETRRVYESVKDIGNANAVKVVFDLADGGCFIGNLSSGKVRDILSGAAEKDYLDCLDLGAKDVSGLEEIEAGVPYVQTVPFMGYQSVDVTGGGGIRETFAANQPGASLFQTSPFGGDPFGAPQAPIFNGVFSGGNAQCRCGCGCGCRCGGSMF